ncbi:MAG: DUF1640 domain-containing protein [Rhodocyclaceae bacterium]|jgi:hypothetical protein|nr:DUF1640 domain-containing protein [Rhodocyclaceae bacterium]
MATTTFDTLKFAERLKAGGVPEAQAKAEAEALAAALAEAMDQQLATKGDLYRIEKEIAALHTEIVVVKWMLGVVVAATVIPLLKPLLGG